MKMKEVQSTITVSSSASTADQTYTLYTDESIAGSNPKIWSWNVDGLRPLLISDSLETFMASAKPDILCLNEIKITEDILMKDELREIMSKWYPMDL